MSFNKMPFILLVDHILCAVIMFIVPFIIFLINLFFLLCVFFYLPWCNFF
jgi:hypothetical protein